jgi:hypothetical protein
VCLCAHFALNTFLHLPPLCRAVRLATHPTLLTALRHHQRAVRVAVGASAAGGAGGPSSPPRCPSRLFDTPSWTLHFQRLVARMVDACSVPRAGTVTAGDPGTASVAAVGAPGNSPGEQLRGEAPVQPGPPGSAPVGGGGRGWGLGAVDDRGSDVDGGGEGGVEGDGVGDVHSGSGSRRAGEVSRASRASVRGEAAGDWCTRWHLLPERRRLVAAQLQAVGSQPN